MPRNSIALFGCLFALAATPLFAHRVKGIENPLLATARAESPTGATDLPIAIDEETSVVCFKIRNTSPHDARITSIGLDLAGDPSGFTLVARTATGFVPISEESGFVLVEGAGNVPGFQGVDLDFALVTGESFAGGKANLGLAPSRRSTTFCVMGPFDQDQPIERMLDFVYLRFQRVGADGELGDVGIWEMRPLP